MWASSLGFFVVILCVGNSLQVNAKSNSNSKVEITLLYECSCPGCRGFITSQLYDTYKKIGAAYIALNLVPYGNVKEVEVNGVVTKTCQHGPKECYGNKVHGCALQHNSIEDSLAFISCCESSDGPVNNSTLRECAQSTNISWTNVESCLSSGEADKIFDKNGEITKKFQPEYVPYVIFNGVFNETLENSALDDLTKVVCDLLGSKKPSVC